MGKNWRPKTDIDPESHASVDDVISELLRLRGIVTPEDRSRFLAPDYDRDLHDPFLFSRMGDVMKRLRKAKKDGERVGLFGDFDADGITSSVLMGEGLRRLGIPFTLHLPDKHSEGHGLSMKAVERFAKEGVGLIVTVDCGTTSHEEIAEAKRRGMDTIVVDHHHAPEPLPDAFAIVNPKVAGENYPFRELCGAGVVFKVLQAIYATFFPKEKDQLKWLLDVVAVGTVADVMPLVDENRVFVSYGLIVLGKTRRPGLRELVSGGKSPIREGDVPTARDIGFHIAPRLNAASRMAHAGAAHDLLAADDGERARTLAETLESHNTERRKVSAEIATLAREIALERPDRNLVFVAHEDFHFGVVGLVAGKLADELGKPTVLLTKGDSESKGSLRSVPGLDIMEVLGECSDLLLRFGGHEQAAGITVANGNLAELEDRMDRIVSDRLGREVVEPDVPYDFRLSPRHLTLDFIRSLGRLSPFGEGNPEPVFLLEGLTVSEARTVGSGGKHLKLLLAFPDGREFDGIGFFLADRVPGLSPGDRVDVLFRPDENEWNGRVSVQLMLTDMRRSGEM